MSEEKQALKLLNITLIELVRTIMAKAIILSNEDLKYFEQQTDKIDYLLKDND